MKIVLFFMIGIILVACNSQQSEFAQVSCIKDSVDSDPGYANIYKPCRQFIFRAKYWDKEYNLISDQRIWMMASGKRWNYDEEQAELVIQYEYDDSEVERIKSFNINKQLSDKEWKRYETEGFTESQSSILFHPFRSNQYLFTEVAPFPMISYTNLQVGAEWSGTLNIQEGWGDWSDSRIEQNYYVSELVNLETEIGNLNDCYHISSDATSEFGRSTFDYWFNMQYGFVKMLYRNYQDQLLQIELIKVIDE